MFCENCGAKMADNDIFCQNCGKRIELPAAQPAPTQSVNQAEQNIPVQQPTASAVPQAEQFPQATTAAAVAEPQAAPQAQQPIPQQMPQVNPYAQQTPQNPYAAPNGQQFVQQQPKKSGFKINKKVIIIASSVAAVLVAGIIVTCVLVSKANNPVNKMVDAINNGDYTEAESIYYKNIDAIDHNQAVIDALQKKIDEIVDQYKNGTIDYDAASGKLNKISGVPLASSTSISEATSEIDKLYYSKKNFEQAEQYFEDKDYTDAIYYYDLVIKDDSNYSKAQEQRGKAVDNIRQKYLDRAKEEADKQNYAYAVYDLQEGLNYNEYLKDDEQLKKQINAYVDEVIKKSDEYMASKEYKKASDIVTDMQNAFDKDSENYTKLDSQLKKVQTEIPTQLADIDINNSDYFYRYQGGSKDVVGNTYDGDNVCSIYISKYSENSYAEMYVKDYKKIKGTIAVKQSIGSNDMTARIEILDEKKNVLYKSATLNSKSKPIDFEVNITDAEWLTIRLVSTKDKSSGALYALLANVEFYKIGSSEPDAPAAETSKPETSKVENSKAESSDEASKNESSKAESSGEASKNESSKAETSKETSKNESSKAA